MQHQPGRSVHGEAYAHVEAVFLGGAGQRQRADRRTRAAPRIAHPYLYRPPGGGSRGSGPHAQPLPGRLRVDRFAARLQVPGPADDQLLALGPSRDRPMGAHAHGVRIAVRRVDPARGDQRGAEDRGERGVGAGRKRSELPSAVGQMTHQRREPGGAAHGDQVPGGGAAGAGRWGGGGAARGFRPGGRAVARCSLRPARQPGQRQVQAGRQAPQGHADRARGDLAPCHPEHGGGVEAVRAGFGPPEGEVQALSGAVLGPRGGEGRPARLVVAQTRFRQEGRVRAGAVAARGSVP